MSLENYFRQVRKLIAAGDYKSLPDVPLTKPEYFNWVTDIFEGINCKDHPDQVALIWTNGTKEEQYSFRQISEKGNQLLNILRANGLEQNDVLFLQLPLVP